MIKTDTEVLVDRPEFSFSGIEDRVWALETQEAKKLLASLPAEIKDNFIKCFLDPANPALQSVADYFVENSYIAKIIRETPSSAHAFEPLYERVYRESPIDHYFLSCKAGYNVYARLLALETNLTYIIRDLLEKTGKNHILIDNIGSGPGRDIIRVFKASPDLAPRVHVRNIDPDTVALKIGQGLVENFGLANSFSFEGKKFNDVESREVDLLILIGIFCPQRIRVCKSIMHAIKPYVRLGGIIVYSTAQDKMGLGDPLTDFIMRFTGWHMSYKTDEEAINIASSAGWVPIGQFFDEPGHYHMMTVAVRN